MGNKNLIKSNFFKDPKTKTYSERRFNSQLLIKYVSKDIHVRSLTSKIYEIIMYTCTRHL